MQQSDGWTDGQTPRLWIRRAKHSAIARKKETPTKKYIYDAAHLRASIDRLQGAAKKWTFKVFRCFFSNRLQF